MSHIAVSKADRILEIRIDRPEKKNAITVEMYGQIADALRQGDADADVRAMLITGTGDVFTSGNDLNDFLKAPPTSEDSPTYRFLRGLARIEKPLVAAVNGLAVGIGSTMLLHCDLVYAAETSWFQFPFVRLALVPEAASSLLLPLRVGQARAAEMLLLSENITAPQALAAGLINGVFPAGEVYGEARSRALRLTELPPAAVRTTKALMRPTPEQMLARMGEEGKAFSAQLTSPEAKEAFTAFLEKRKPDFSRF